MIAPEVRQAIDSLRNELGARLAALEQLGGGLTVNGDLRVTGSVQVRNTANGASTFELNPEGASYNGGHSILGRFGVDNEGMGDAQVWHSEAGGYQFYAALGMTPLTDDGDAGLILQAWKNPGEDLLINGSFESGDFTGWTKTTESHGEWNVAAGDSYDGDYHAQFISYGDENVGSGVLTSDTIDIERARYYLIQGRVRKNGAKCNLAVYVEMDFGDTTKLVCAAELDNQSVPEEEYIRFSCIMQAPPSANAIGSAVVKLKAWSHPAVLDPITFEFDALTFCGVMRGVSLDLSRALFDETEHYNGTDELDDRNTSSSYTTQIMVLRVFNTLKINYLSWKIRKAGTYELHRLYAPNVANTYGILWSGTTTTEPEIVTIRLSPPVKLTPGVYYFGMKSTGGAVLWQDKNDDIYYAGDNADGIGYFAHFMLDGIYYNTNAFNYLPPVMLNYQMEGTAF